MNPNGSATRELARFIVTSKWSDLPPKVQHEAKRSLLNFFGVALGGCADEAIERAIAVLKPFAGPPQAAVIGRAERFDQLNAAFLNAASANVLDFDDTHHPSVIHPSAPVVAVLLAIAEQQPMRGEQFLLALVLGIEVACRLGNSVSTGHYVRGWHITSTCAVVGAAAAAAKALGLNLRQTIWALGHGANQACGLVESLGSMAKSVSVGNAARNGLTSAYLARAEFNAADTTLEGPRGFIEVLGYPPNANALIQGLGRHWEMLNNAIKPYPSGVVLHSVVDACLTLHQQHRPPVRDIKRICIRGNPLLVQRADRVAPRSGREAAVSAQHSAAVCFLFGAAGIEQYQEQCVLDQAVQALGRRVSVEQDAEITVEAAEVSVEMLDGAQYHARIDHALGSLARPLSDTQLEQKVRQLAAIHQRKLAINPLIDAIWRFDQLDDAAAVISIVASQHQ